MTLTGYKYIYVLHYVHFFTVIGASLSKPHIDHDNGLHTRNICGYIFIYYGLAM